jgi:predicted helicase
VSQLLINRYLAELDRLRRVSGANRIRYGRRPELETREEKLVSLHNAPLVRMAPEELRPDQAGNWLNITSNDFGDFLPMASKDVKSSRPGSQDKAIFRIFSLGISTNRDDWLYDRDRQSLMEKVRHLIKAYCEAPVDVKHFPDTLKWSETLKRRKQSRESESFADSHIRRAAYRPFNMVTLYQSPLFIDRPGLADQLFPPKSRNRAICFSDIGSRTHYCVLAVDGIADLHFGAAVDGYQQVARYRYEKDGSRLDNITDWALAQFVAHYGESAPITKDGIFAYVYGVLHDPIYRETYALNLKREFPRIPFYPDFARWRDWGQTLLDLHIGYESADPFPLVRTDLPDAKVRAGGQTPRVILKADRDNGIIILDAETQLSGVPKPAWDYQLGNRSAIDWVLDQHKEKTPKDPTIRERFDTYRFADHKEKVVDLLARVARVSAETVAIVEAMRAAPRDPA